MNEIISRDKNHMTIGAGVTNDVSQNISMLRVDPATKYLLTSLSFGSSSAATATQIAKRDQNYRTVCLAWDETNQVLQEVLTDSSGNLLADITFI